MVKKLEPDVTAENEALKQQFANAGLDLAPVWRSAPEDPELENRQLRKLWRWVEAYSVCPDRHRLHQRGFLYPPIDPDFDPETDWLRFEKWLRGEPLSWRYPDEFGELPPAENLADTELGELLNELLEVLFEHGVSVDVDDAVPDRELYVWLRETLATSEFEIGAPGSFWHIGCPAWCADCFQRDCCPTRAEIESEPAG